MLGRKSITTVVAVLSGLMLTRLAKADMGSLWVEEVAKTSIRVNWQDPGLGHRFATESPSFTLTVEAVAAYPYLEPAPPASKRSFRISGPSAKPYTITHLSPDTSYRITLEAYAEKLTSFGEWINPKDRLLGVVRQKTSSAEPGPNLQVSATGTQSATLDLTNPRFAGVDVVRVAYKVKGSRWPLNSTAADSASPELNWVTSDAAHGWQDALSVGPGLAFTFKGLSPATSYEVVAYAFKIQSAQGVKLGSAMLRTGGYAPVRTEAESVALDHLKLLETYGSAIGGRLTRNRVLDLVLGCNVGFYELYQEVRQNLLTDEGVSLDDNLNALQYLITQQPEAFACWQVQEEADDAGLSLKKFLATLPPALFPRVEGEIIDSEQMQGFQRGDADRSGVLDLSDAVRMLQYMFLGSLALPCMDAADANDSGEIEVGDPVFLLTYLYSSGSQPPAPFGACGQDTTPDLLTCEEYNGCPR